MNSDITATGEGDLDGGRHVQLAPVQGVDIRRSLPADFFPKRPARFLMKFWLAMGIIVLSYATIALSVNWALTAAAMLLLGLTYVHLVELQHECAHEHAFNSRRLNRVYGVACGLFMLTSYTHYKYDHLRHHASLGKPNNREFYDYRFRGLDSLGGFLRATFHYGRFKDIARDLLNSIRGRPVPNVTTERDRKRITIEYRIFAVLIVAAVGFTVLTGSLLFVLGWLIPLILVSEPAHFLVELPEHFGLNTQTNPDALSNTRTIEASRFAAWFTNFNNLHTAHHYHQGVPMANVTKLDGLVKAHYTAVEPSYWTFYRKVMRGEIRYENPEAESCMTR